MNWKVTEWPNTKVQYDSLWCIFVGSLWVRTCITPINNSPSGWRDIYMRKGTYPRFLFCAVWSGTTPKRIRLSNKNLISSYRVIERVYPVQLSIIHFFSLLSHQFTRTLYDCYDSNPSSTTKIGVLKVLGNLTTLTLIEKFPYVVVSRGFNKLVSLE